MLNKLVKILLIIATFYQTSAYSKSASFNELNSKDLSNYFSGIVAFQNRNNNNALRFFSSSKILLNKHNLFLKRYIYSLVLENKVTQAINIIKNNVEKKDLNFFDAYLLLTIDSLKKNDFTAAQQYLTQTLKFQANDQFHQVIYEILNDAIYTFKEKKILLNKKNFGNISAISLAFQRCYLEKKSTRTSFLNLINDPNGDYSRYIYFYANYLIENKKINEVKEIFEKVKFINSTLLLTQTKSWVENNKYKNFEKLFSCKNHNDIVSEFLFLISNLYSAQQDLSKSNFYLNLSNYLNPKFKFNLSLAAENYYSTNQYEKVKKILQNFNKDDQFYYWFRTKKETQIIMKEKGEESGIEFITSRFNKFEKPNLKVIFDIANFFKNSKKYEKAAQYYSQIIPKFEEDSTIKSDLLYRRGSSYERLKRYKESDEDFLSSMKVNPNDAYVLNYLAYSWLERDYKIDEAMSMLKKAYSLKNDDPYIIDSIGWAHYLIDDYLEAEKYLKRAVELMPDDPIVNDHYGDILWKLNRKLQARYFWNNVLSFEDVDDKIKQDIDLKLIEGLKNS